MSHTLLILVFLGGSRGGRPFSSRAKSVREACDLPNRLYIGMSTASFMMLIILLSPGPQYGASASKRLFGRRCLLICERHLSGLRGLVTLLQLTFLRYQSGIFLVQAAETASESTGPGRQQEHRRLGGERTANQHPMAHLLHCYPHALY